MTDLPAVDLILGGIILVSMLLGLWRGLVRELLSLAIWTAALVLGALFASRLGDALLTSVVSAPLLRTSLGFALVFLGTLIGGAIFTRLLDALVHSAGLTGTDRLLGLLFGMARGALLVVVMVVVLHPIAHTYPWWQESWIITAADRLRAEVAIWLDWPLLGEGLRATGVGI